MSNYYPLYEKVGLPVLRLKAGAANAFCIFLAVLISLVCILTSPKLIAKEPLVIKEVNSLYHLNSVTQATAFIPVPTSISSQNIAAQYYDDVFLNNLMTSNASQATTRPDFNIHQRYAMYVELNNKSEHSEWLFQISHLLIKRIDIFVVSRDTQQQMTVQTTTRHSNHYDTNLLGRAVPVKLKKDAVSKVLIVLHANDIKPPLYIGLLSDYKYRTWSASLDFFFLLAIGIVVGFVLLSMTCFLIARDQTFLWFAISTSLILVITLLRSPFGINMFAPWDGFPPWLWTIVGLMQLSILLFVKSFLLITSASASSKVFKLAIFVISLTIGLGYLFNNEINIRLFSVTSFLVVLLVIWVGMLKAIKEGTIYVIFMLGWLPIAYSIVKSIYLQFALPDPFEVTISYYHLEGPYLQVAHFFLHFVAMVLQILENKKLQLLAKAESKAKTSFLAQLSHDLRQPLDAMGLIIDHLDDQVTEPKAQRLVSNTKQLHKSMYETFAALSDLTQLEAGQLKPRLENVVIQDVFTELYSEYQQSFHVKNLSFRWRHTTLVIETDRVLLKRILSNLLSNACKYTTKGGVLMALRQHKSELLFQVWDTGSGIPQDKLVDIFNIYFQASRPLEHSQRENQQNMGSGIGLATIQHIAQLLGYKIDLQTKMGKGSVFTLRVGASMLIKANKEQR